MDRIPLCSGTHTRGYLPHIKREGASYFVTFRLADSLPREIYLKLRLEHAKMIRLFERRMVAAKSLAASKQPLVDMDLIALERMYLLRLEEALDSGFGSCWLRNPDIAEIVSKAMCFFEGERYRLAEWVVMPNHVHAVVQPHPSHSLSDILQSWKRFSAREANRLLERTGSPFWQRESYDHWIRNDLENERCCRYVVFNPVKARLCRRPEQWRWSSARKI